MFLKEKKKKKKQGQAIRSFQECGFEQVMRKENNQAYTYRHVTFNHQKSRFFFIFTAVACFLNAKALPSIF